MSGSWARRSVALIAVWLLTGCGNGDQPDEMARDAAIYRSVLTDIVDRSGVEFESDEDLPVLYIEALGPDGVPLEVQVEVVGSFVEEYEVRFIDTYEEAVDVELPGLPVPEGALLIGLGDIDVGVTAEVHSEFYLRLGQARGFGYTLASLDGRRWEIVSDPTETEAEGLVPTP